MENAPADADSAKNQVTNSSRPDLEQILRGIRPEFDFTQSEDFIADGMLDSYDIVMLVADLDKTFGIALAGVDIVPENFRNIAAIEGLLHRYGVER